jgi:hypothetical protein
MQHSHRHSPNPKPHTPNPKLHPPRPNPHALCVQLRAVGRHAYRHSRHPSPRQPCRCFSCPCRPCSPQRRWGAGHEGGGRWGAGHAGGGAVVVVGRYVGDRAGYGRLRDACGCFPSETIKPWLDSDRVWTPDPLPRAPDPLNPFTPFNPQGLTAKRLSWCGSD